MKETLRAVDAVGYVVPIVLRLLPPARSRSWTFPFEKAAGQASSPRSTRASGRATRRVELALQVDEVSSSLASRASRLTGIRVLIDHEPRDPREGKAEAPNELKIEVDLVVRVAVLPLSRRQPQRRLQRTRGLLGGGEMSGTYEGATGRTRPSTSQPRQRSIIGQVDAPHLAGPRACRWRAHLGGEPSRSTLPGRQDATKANGTFEPSRPPTWHDRRREGQDDGHCSPFPRLNVGTFSMIVGEAKDGQREADEARGDRGKDVELSWPTGGSRSSSELAPWRALVDRQPQASAVSDNYQGTRTTQTKGHFRGARVDGSGSHVRPRPAE